MQQEEINAILSLDRPGRLAFGGCRDAELFSFEVYESLKGIFDRNFIREGDQAGFLLCSLDGRPWSHTSWTRDDGCMLREFVAYGYLGHAAILADCLMRLVLPNEDGYYSYPMYFREWERGSGDEIDGTAAILIGMAMLARRLKAIDSPIAQKEYSKIVTFVTQDQSSLRFLLDTIERDGLISGSGEFGGGLGVAGAWCNVVQNQLSYLSAHAWIDLLRGVDDSLCDRCLTVSESIVDMMRKHLLSDEGWVWCVRPGDFEKVQEILDTPENKGFTGVNGVAAMYADVFGFTPLQDQWWGCNASIKTFRTLLDRPIRRRQYDAYGMYVQFENHVHGVLSSPSYGMGYAIQTALLMDMLPEAGKMLSFLANTTYEPNPKYELTRDSKGWFYERMLSPDYYNLPEEQQDIEEGCGALNIVNVAEPLKAARLAAGLDDTKNFARFIPRLPEGWENVKLENWPILHEGKLYHADIEYSKKEGIQVTGLPFELEFVK